MGDAGFCSDRFEAHWPKATSSGALEQMRRHMYGLDGIPSTPDEVLSAVTGTTTSSLEILQKRLRGQVDAEWGSRIRAVLDPVLGQIGATQAVLEANAHTDLRMALMGRTTHGKSTLFEFLSGGDGASIGLGGQRTTRRVIERSMPQVPGALLIDTPGLGARGGEQDTRLAMRAVQECDVVVWVLANDSLQQEVIEGLQAVAATGKPLVVALNCRADISSPGKVRRLLRDPDGPFRGAAGHIERLRDALASTHQACMPPVFELHAAAAFDGLLRDDTALVSASRVGALVDALRLEAGGRAATRRVATRCDSAVTVLGEAITSIEFCEDILGQSARLTTQAAHELSVRLTGKIQLQEVRAQTDVGVKINNARLWPTRVDLTADVQALWEQEEDALNHKIHEALVWWDEETIGMLKDEGEQVIDDWTMWDGQVGFVSAPDLSATGNRIAKVGVRAVLVVATGIGLFVSWPVALGIGVAGAAADHFVLPRALDPGGLIDKLLPSRKRKMDAARRAISGEVTAILDTKQRDALASVSQRVAQLMDQVSVIVDEQISHASSMALAASSLAADREWARAAVQEVELGGAVSILRLEGRQRVAEQVVSVHRNACGALGVGLATKRAAAELQLFPVQGIGRLMCPFSRDAGSSPRTRAIEVIASALPPPYRFTVRNGVLNVQVPTRDPHQLASLTQLASGAAGTGVLCVPASPINPPTPTRGDS